MPAPTPATPIVTPTAVTTRELVLGMVGDDGRIDAGELYDVAEVCGFTYHQVRLCLARLVEEGLLDQDGRGRRATFTATATGHRTIGPEAEFLRLAWAQDAGLAGWDGAWHLVGFNLGEDHRDERNAFRDHLVVVLGGSNLLPGLYVSAHAWESLVEPFAAELGIAGRIVVAQTRSLSVGDASDPRDVARHLWDLDTLAARWAGFVEHAEAAGPVLDGDDARAALGAAVALVGEFGAIIRTDPLLPRELLPDDWPGVAARALLLAATRSTARARRSAGVPALFRRYDATIAEIDPDG